MSMKQKLDQLEKKVTELTGKPGERGTIIILRTWLHGPDAVLTGYRHHTGVIWPVDRSQWPHVPAGTRVVIQQVWSDTSIQR